MSLLGKLQPVIIIFAALLGLAVGAITPFGTMASGLVEVFLMLLLYILFLSIDLKQIKKSLTNIRFTISAAAINFIFTPVLSYVLGRIFFAGALDIRIGLLMLLVTPCTDWYLVFTGISKGNKELGLSVLPLNLILQVVLLPVYLFIFIGSQVTVDMGLILRSIVMVLVIPFIASCVTKRLTASHTSWGDFISARSDDLQLLFLSLAVIVMFASEGRSLLLNPLLLLKMFVPLLIFFVLVFFIAQAVGRVQHFSKRDTIALNFTTLARNSPLALAIAVVTFPDQPLISLALVIGPLIELPVLTIISSILREAPLITE